MIYKIVIVAVIIILIFLAVKFFFCKKFEKCQLFNDILKEKDPDKILKYSQGRIYLLFSLVAYYITIGLLTSKALKPTIGIDSGTIDTIIAALQWVIMLMAGYVFGGKGLDVLKLIMTKKTPPAEIPSGVVNKVNEIVSTPKSEEQI